MALIVQKFGGTSMGTTERIKSIAGRIAAFKVAGHQLVVVVSAISGETNRLVALAKEIQPDSGPREFGKTATCGRAAPARERCTGRPRRGPGGGRAARAPPSAPSSVCRGRRCPAALPGTSRRSHSASTRLRRNRWRTTWCAGISLVDDDQLRPVTAASGVVLLGNELYAVRQIGGVALHE